MKWRVSPSATFSTLTRRSRSGADIRWPDMLAAPVPREGIGVDVINRVFRDGVSSGLLDKAMLPPLAKLSSRRIGLLTHLRGSDIREKYGVMVAQARRMAAFCFVGYFVGSGTEPVKMALMKEAVTAQTDGPERSRTSDLRFRKPLL
jgi:hypothetical protein